MPGAALRLTAKVETRILSEFGGDVRALRICRQFATHADLGHSSFFDHILGLIRVARGESGDAWEVRRLAALLLEHQVAIAIQYRPDKADVLLVALGLKAPGAERVHGRLLEEGFTASDVKGFLAQLLLKIQRRNVPVRGRRALSSLDWEDLFHRSKQDCKLVLARYLMTPADVVGQIVSQVGVSEGVRDETRIGPAEEQSVDASPYETEIVRELAKTSRIFWVKDATSSRINSLVEFPLGTVALVVKPPGSDLEIELKRAGMRRRPLDVLFEEGIYPVPYSHRLQGGSPGLMLLSEAHRAAHFRSLYRAAHGEDPVMSRIVATAHVNAVPTSNGQLDLLTYFTDPRAFGEGFERMRAQLSYCAVNAATGPRRQVPPGELALTVAFLRDIKPRQSIIIRTSSFRLDVLRKYLSAQGPEAYFGDGLRSSYTAEDARRFADDLLEEVLGTYVPPASTYRSYEQYVSAALNNPENRAAADQAYTVCMRQIGAYWGTLLAAGGHTSGESFVARNVGLKSAWIDGRWCARCIFMDHDSLVCPNSNDQDFYVEAYLNGAFLDQRYVFGSIREKDTDLGSVECLQSIYGVDPPAARSGERALCTAMASAYKEVRRQLLPGGRLRSFLGNRLIEALSHFDEVVRMSLGMDEGAGTGPWQPRARRWLGMMGYDQQLCRKFVELIARHEPFFRVNDYLYRP
jgi:hypothetical protein